MVYFQTDPLGLKALNNVIKPLKPKINKPKSYICKYENNIENTSTHKPFRIYRFL